MQFGHPFVVTPEKSREILRQIFFVEFCEGAHDAKVKGDVAPKCVGFQAHLNVARMHIGMEKTVTKHLREEQGHTIPGQLRNVDARIAQAFYLADRYTDHTLHDDDFGVAKIPNHFGNQYQIQTVHIAAQLCRVGRLAHQVKLIVQVLVKFRHHLFGFESLAIRTQTFDPTGHHAHERNVFFDHGQHLRAQDFHRHIALHTQLVF